MVQKSCTSWGRFYASQVVVWDFWTINSTRTQLLWKNPMGLGLGKGETTSRSHRDHAWGCPNSQPHGSWSTGREVMGFEIQKSHAIEVMILIWWLLYTTVYVEIIHILLFINLLGRFEVNSLCFQAFQCCWIFVLFDQFAKWYKIYIYIYAHIHPRLFSKLYILYGSRLRN